MPSNSPIAHKPTKKSFYSCPYLPFSLLFLPVMPAGLAANELTKACQDWQAGGSPLRASVIIGTTVAVTAGASIAAFYSFSFLLAACASVAVLSNPVILGITLGFAVSVLAWRTAVWASVSFDLHYKPYELSQGRIKALNGEALNGETVTGMIQERVDKLKAFGNTWSLFSSSNSNLKVRKLKEEIYSIKRGKYPSDEAEPLLSELNNPR